ncbi:hypothetical protein [Geodermatophilus sabuli]|uniref:Uncharacterized protein n=1 Tax=Geodermatophilus sabuli TaxID=1564158 RepID=A0A285EB54_9ACTN|nr:hypothetical protein [Geodermatophilus sabuli]MBB3084374.1 hypothetical protein [Geodermatophilus sabuli]SNX96358.1 hypothetical protein SAMN06893097_10472 [Geodermatophilus sabuli]
MDTNVVTVLCGQLGYDPATDPATVLVIRIGPGHAGVTYSDPTGTPHGSTHRLEVDGEEAA